MQKFTFHRDRTGLFSEQQNRLVYRQEELLSFLHLPFELHSFEQQIKRKQFSPQQRELLVDVLNQQYMDRPSDPAVRYNLDKLKE
jgi:bacillithiol synthase